MKEAGGMRRLLTNEQDKVPSYALSC